MKNTIGHGGKVKRDATDDGIADEAEYAAPVYQNAPLDYTDLRESLSDFYTNYDDIQNEKRFLGKCSAERCNETVDGVDGRSRRMIY